jgi:hypothetical protein
MITRVGVFGAILTALLFSSKAAAQPTQQFRRLPVKEYRDKMRGGWIGQMVGVAWGAPTEQHYNRIIPAGEMPLFRDTLVNDAFNQDDLYVEMTFLRSMEEHGLNVSARQAGIDFANSRYPLWVANEAGRYNLRRGIAPPDSSHPAFNKVASAIDYQIEADYSGLIAPGMPQVAVRLGENFGRLMNYGDGTYAGQFIGGMYAEAFFEKDMTRVVEAGLACIPEQSRYAEMIRDLLKWHREHPNRWEKTWDLSNTKYRSRDYHDCVLDAKLEGAFVVLGLLYGQGDPDKTIILACRCGSDSDCNPSSAAGVLGTSLGASKLPGRYAEKLDKRRIFSHTAYNFPELVDVCEKLARQAVEASGGCIEKNAAGDDVFVIPVKPPTPSAFDDVRSPGPTTGSRFTAEEMARIKPTPLPKL